MASTTILNFASTLSPTVPTFVGKGSKIEVPDLQVVFWGPSWPGNGQLSVGGLMQAVNSIVTGPYLEGMKQYGYTGPVKVRQPIVNTGNPNISYPAPGPNVDQSTSLLQTVQNLVQSMEQNDAMGDVSSNHHLLVMVFLDPTIPFPRTFDANGNPQSTIFGEHAKYERPRTLAPAVRFAYGWVGTRPGSGMGAFDQSTWTFSHELVEAISNPFPNSGWIQTAPASASGSGEIGDICNNTACVVDSIAVQPYWGVQQGQCILPTESRQLHLAQSLIKHIPLDGPTQQANVDMGVLCGGVQTFDYVERTFHNVVTVNALHPGYEVPQYTWTVNGTVVPAGNSTISVPATWDPPRVSLDFRLLHDITDRVHNPIHVFGGGPNGLPHAIHRVGDAGSVVVKLKQRGLGRADGPVTDAVQEAISAADRARVPVPAPFEHKAQATIHVTVFDSVLLLDCGPGEGNCSVTVNCQAVENWDGLTGTTVTTRNTSQIEVIFENQEIVWGDAFHKAAQACSDKIHKKAGGGGRPKGPINPGDPGPEGIVDRVRQGNLPGQVRKIPNIDRHE